jgi:guanylate kinase
LGADAPLKPSPSPVGAGIALVGPCGAGKTTVAELLKAQGLKVAEIAQEHSCVPNLWKQRGSPTALIFLDANFVTCTQRKRFRWTSEDYEEQCRRLQHARQHADLLVRTDAMTPAQVVDQVLRFLRRRSGPSLKVP